MIHYIWWWKHMIDIKWKNNELYNLINSQIDDKELVDNIFNCILPQFITLWQHIYYILCNQNTEI